MIRHLVLFKLNEGVERDDPRVVAGDRAFRELAGQVPELEFWECAWNITDRPIAYDYAINSAVADEDALKRYIEHPAHQAAAWPVARIRHLGDRRLPLLIPLTGTGPSRFHPTPRRSGGGFSVLFKPL